MEFLERWLSPRLARAAAAIERVPLKVATHGQWMVVSHEVRECQDAIRELRRLAQWLKKPRRVNRSA